MTDEQKMQQRKDLLYDCEQAEIHLSHVLDNAKSTAEELRDMFGLFEYHADASRGYNPDQPDIYRRAGKGVDLNNP